MKNQAADLEPHVHRIYDSAVAPGGWPEFLDGLREELHLASAHLVFRHPSDGDRGIIASVGTDDRFDDAYRSHFYRLNPWRPYGPEAEEGRVLLNDSILSESEQARTEFYNDWMRPQGIAHPFTAFLYNAAPREPLSTLVGFREKTAGPLEQTDLDPVRALVPHLQRALAIHSRVQGARVRAKAAEDVLDRISGGVILLDERGAPIAVNRTAERILAAQDGLALDADGPSASTSKQTAELRRAVAGASRTRAGQGASAGGVMRLSRPSGRPALEAVVTPIGRATSPLFEGSATCAILLAEPDARTEPPPARLARLYRLTRVEAEVASRIARGMRLRAIGEELGVSIHTVRGHLKQLFSKTNTHRQAELVRTLLSGLAGLRLE
jgi:DNA-binding CsgD family transcriptional regulator/PAS domain-containing protein